MRYFSFGLSARRLALIVGLLAGFAPGPPAAAEEKSVTLSLQVDVQPKAAEQRRPVRPGEVLHNGDRIALRVAVDRRAYVYVLQVFPNGKSAILFPQPGSKQADVLVEPGGQRSIPAGGEMFELDDEVGQENLLAVASTRPLAAADPELGKQFGASSDGGSARPATDAPSVSTLESSASDSALRRSAEAAPPPPPPVPLTIRERGLAESKPDSSKPHVLKAKGNDKGVALVHFGFQHAAPLAAKSVKR